MITLPQLSYLLLKNRISVVNTENRNLASFSDLPEFDLKNINQYPNILENIWNDNLPYRIVMKNFYTDASIKLFHTSTDSRVIIGKNDGSLDTSWLFYNKTSDGDPLSYVVGSKRYSDDMLNKFHELVLNKNKYFGDKNIKHYYFIMPNKSTIYSEKLPSGIKNISNYNMTNQLSEYLNGIGIDNFYYLKDILNLNKQKYELYYRLDTHWNFYGAYIGFLKMIEIIEPNLSIPPAQIQDGGMIERQGDLYNFLGTTRKMKDNSISVHFLDEISYTTETEEKYKHTHCDNALLDKKIVIVGDSFGGYLLPYFSRIYKDVYYVVRTKVNNIEITKFMPDVIIEEAVERYTLTLLQDKFN